MFDGAKQFYCCLPPTASQNADGVGIGCVFAMLTISPSAHGDREIRAGDVDGGQ